MFRDRGRQRETGRESDIYVFILARYWQTQAAKGTQVIPKGYQKDNKSEPRGDQNASKNKDRKKVSAAQCFGAILAPLGRVWNPDWRPVSF